MQDLSAPPIESLKGEIGAVRAEIKGVPTGIHGESGALRTEIHGEIGMLRADRGAVRTEMQAFCSETQTNLAAWTDRVSTEVRRLE